MVLAPIIPGLYAEDIGVVDTQRTTSGEAVTLEVAVEVNLRVSNLEVEFRALDMADSADEGREVVT